MCDPCVTAHRIYGHGILAAYLSLAIRMFKRLLCALPDSVTAAFFLMIWIAPLGFGDYGVRNAMLIMLVEFFLVHASGMFGAVVFKDHVPLCRRMLDVLPFGLPYALFIGSCAYFFEAWWPFLAFGWLLIGKIALVLDPGSTDAERRQQMQARWATTGMVYVIGVMVTSIMPLPRLGITPDLLPRLDLPGSGLWVEKPHTVIAFGVFYFSILAWNNWREAKPAIAK